VGIQKNAAPEVSAWVAMAEKDHETAIRNMREVLMRDSGSEETLFRLNFLARAYLAAGYPDSAETVLKDILKVWGGHAVAHYELGRAYEAMDRPADASDEYAIFLDMWSEADEGIQELEDARRRHNELEAKLNKRSN
jgi:predicted Zn-dependent protease